MQEGVNFAVYASSATSVSVCLFTEADLQGGRVTHEVPLSPELNRTGYIWHILLPSLDSTLLYGRPHGSHARACIRESLKMMCEHSAGVLGAR